MPIKKKVLCLLEDRDVKIVQRQEAKDGEGFNAALRKIIREWSVITHQGTDDIATTAPEELVTSVE